MTKKHRTEKDALGETKVPKEAYFGSFTARAQKNFQISNLKSPEIFRIALGTIKLSASQTNLKLNLLKDKQGKAIIQATKEFIEGKFNNDFILDVFQAGAGTSYNMNANEIIANRANEILGHKKGSYREVHPNDHINLSQSSNDVIPTSCRLAILLSLPNLFKEIAKTKNSLKKLQKKHKNTLKVGRTHLQDAVPITFGQEIDSYKEALTKSRKFLEHIAKDLYFVNIGGTAVGTGINTNPQYKELMIENLTKLTNIPFKKTKNSTEINNNMNSFLNVSAALRSLAINLLNISNDLKLMNSGPQAGFNEIILPAVQPGSSIMPGKINPSILECLDMICAQIIGNDKTIEISAQKSNFELNTMCPLIMFNLLQSIEILSNGLKMFRNLALENLKILTKNIKNNLEKSTCMATVLTPYLGYHLTSDIVKTALNKNTTIKEEILERNLFTEKELAEILSTKNQTSPALIKKEFIKKTQ